MPASYTALDEPWRPPLRCGFACDTEECLQTSGGTDDQVLRGRRGDPEGEGFTGIDVRRAVQRGARPLRAEAFGDGHRAVRAGMVGVQEDERVPKPQRFGVGVVLDAGHGLGDMSSLDIPSRLLACLTQCSPGLSVSRTATASGSRCR